MSRAGRAPGSRIPLLAAGALLALVPAPAGAQGRSRCTLFLDGTTPESRSVSFSDPLARDAYVTHMSRGVLGRCGDARMTADSAIDFDRLGRLELYGDVRYRDTIRTLESGRLTYFEVEDRVLAEQEVVLTRTRSGSVLRGPRVEFFRVPALGDRTVATGRPHMTLRGLSGETAEPFEVDADVAEFEGEREARARGAVVIRRSDLDATADSALFDLEAGEGTLHGDPRVRAEAYELTGDSVRVRFETRELREVHAFGDARATGDGFDIRSGQVKAMVGGGEVEEAWAFGGPRALGVSEGYELWGDSLRFRFTSGTLDSTVAVGRAAAVEGTQGRDAPLARGPLLVAAPGANWLVGDTIRARFAPAGGTAAGTTPEGGAGGAEGEGGGRGRRPLEELRAVGGARSYYAAVRDTARTRRPSRSYLVGREIAVRFEDGEAVEVRGVDAVGIYLEPDEALAAADTLPGAADTLPKAADTLPPGAQTPPAPPDDPAPPEVSAGAEGEP